MSSPTDDFFAALGERGHIPSMQKVTGTVRFDLDEGSGTEHWLLSVTNGDIEVSRHNTKADAIFHTDRALFDRLATGEANVMAAVLRGAVSVDGDPGLLVLFQRIFPAPPSSRERSIVGAGRRQS